jgi:hypothetical protein
MYNQTTITAAAVAGSATGTLSATPGVNIAVGDEFGVRRTVQSDGQTVSGESPSVWYTVSGVDTVSETKTLTLSEAFAETSNPTATFITAQVSDLEAFRPGRLRLALAEYAAADALLSRSPVVAAALGQAAAAAVAGYADDTAGYIFKETAIYTMFPQLFARR